jgi:hypothetical protein
MIDGSREEKPGIHVPAVGSGPVQLVELASGPSVAADLDARNNASGGGNGMTSSYRTPVRPLVDLVTGSPREAGGSRPNFLRDLTTLLQTLSSIVDGQPELAQLWKQIMEKVRAARIGELGGYFDVRRSGPLTQVPGLGGRSTTMRDNDGTQEIKKIVSALAELVGKLEDVGTGPAGEQEVGRGRGEGGRITFTRVGRVPRGMVANVDPYATYQRALEKRVKVDDARLRYQAGESTLHVQVFFHRLTNNCFY